MSNLSDLLPAGAAAKQLTFTDSGSGITTKKPVVLNSDGTVSEVIGSTQSIGTESVFESATVYDTGIAYDSNENKVVVAYKDGGNSNYGTAIVGTISGTSVSWGTPVVFDTTNCSYIVPVFDSNSNKIVINYRGSSNWGISIVGTVSGTSISFGSYVTFHSGITDYIGACFDSSNNKVVIAYRDNGASNEGEAVVGTVSGTSISFGSTAQFETGNTTFSSPVFDNNSNKVVISFSDQGDSGKGKAVVGTVSGTSISYGTTATFSTGDSVYMGSTFDSNSNKVVTVYRDDSDSQKAKSVVGTVSGTDITFGTAVVYSSVNALPNVAAFDSDTNQVIVAYTVPSASYAGKFVRGTVSGTSISFSSEFTYASGNTDYTSICYDTGSDRIVIAFQDTANSNYGTATVIQVGSTNLTAQAFVGIADSAISASAAGSIIVQGGTVSGLAAELATGSPTNLTGKTQSPYPDITYDITQDKFVVFFEDGNNSNFGTAVVVTVSGSTVSFGTPVVFNSGTTIALGATYSQANGRHVVVYPNYSDSQKATAAVGTVSGTSISFGTPVVFDSTITNTQCSVAYNSTLGKYLAGAMTSTIKVTVLTVDPSDNSVTFGTPVSLTGTRYKPNIVSNESASDFVLTNNLNDNQAEAHLISVSGTTPTVEDTETISSVVSTSYPVTGLVFLENNKFVCVTNEYNTNNTFTRTITVSGTSLSIGTQSASFTIDVDSQTTINGRWPLFFVSTTEAYLYYQDDTSNYLKYVPITISGTTATSGTELTYHSTAVAYSGFGYNSSTKQSLSFFQDGSQTKGLAQNGALVIGTDYYVTTSGSFSSSAGAPSVNAGLAISTTSLLLNGDS